MGEAYQVLPTNFVSYGEVGRYQWQLFDLSIVDPWRVKMISQCLAEMLTALWIGWILKGRYTSYAVVWAVFFLFRLSMELYSGNPSTLLLFEAAALAILMLTAWVHNRYEIKRNPLRVVHRSWDK